MLCPMLYPLNSWVLFLIPGLLIGLVMVKEE